MRKHDFGWGDTRGIREIMMKHIPGKFLEVDWENCGYPPHGGNLELIEEVRDLIVDLTNKRYKYVLITNGATHALNAYISAVKNGITKTLITHPLYFRMYPGIAKIHGLEHKTDSFVNPSYYGAGEIGIVDSPSNPEGKLTAGPVFKVGTVWDAAYYTPTYCGYRNDQNALRCIKVMPNHDAMAGSLSKLTGLNGLRIGWLATDNDDLFHKAYRYVEHDLCGASNPSQQAALQLLKTVDLQEFYVESKALLDNNRDTISRLSHIFGNQPIFQTGMYALFEIDLKLSRLLDKADVNTLSGQSIGDTKRDSVRFNLANSAKATKAMVNAILKADKI